MSTEREILGWLARYGGYDTPVTMEGELVIDYYDRNHTSMMSANDDYDPIARLERRITNRHAKVIKILHNIRDPNYYGHHHHPSFKYDITEADFLNYLADYYELQELKTDKAARRNPNRQQRQHQQQHQYITSTSVNRSLETDLTRSQAAASRERELRHHERERQEWQRKRDISNQFRAAATTSQTPAPQLDNGIRRRSKIEQLQQAGLTERQSSGGSQTSRSRPTKQPRPFIDEDEEEILAARRSAYSGAYDLLH